MPQLPRRCCLGRPWRQQIPRSCERVQDGAAPSSSPTGGLCRTRYSYIEYGYGQPADDDAARPGAPRVPGGSERERYGLDLATEAGLEPGTIYPILVAFENAGWLRSREEDEVDPHLEGRPRRRYYRLTPDGLSAA